MYARAHAAALLAAARVVLTRVGARTQEVSDIFSTGGGDQLASEYKLPFLGACARCALGRNAVMRARV